jgi:cobalt/nickel transport protein
VSSTAAGPQQQPVAERRRPTGLYVAALVVALVLAAVVSHHASPEPDGLERVAEDHGFADAAADHPLEGSPVADYSVRGVGDESLSVGLAGAAGVLLTLLLAGGLLLVLRGGGRRHAGTGTGTG